MKAEKLLNERGMWVGIEDKFFKGNTDYGLACLKITNDHWQKDFHILKQNTFHSNDPGTNKKLKTQLKHIMAHVVIFARPENRSGFFFR